MHSFVNDSKSSIWLSKPMLKARGWTDSSIKKFLPEPERFKVNPHYSSKSPMPVWSPTEVAKAESTGEWQTWLEKSLTRRNTTLTALSAPVDMPEWLDAKLDRAQEYIEKYSEDS